LPSTVTLDGKTLPAQCEKEASNLHIEWRKRVVVDAELPPSQISRLDVTFRKIKAKPRPKLRARNGRIRVAGKDLTVDINTRTGLIDSARLGRQQFLDAGAGQILCLADDDDAWGTHQHRFPRRGQALRLVSKARARQLNGGLDVEPVQIVEDGPVRRVIEATFQHDQTTAQVRYLLPRNHPWIDLEVTLLAAPPRTMCKLRLPLAFRAVSARCQSVYDQPERAIDGTEHSAQKWVAALGGSAAADKALAAVNNGTYAFDCTESELRLNLLRTPCYSFLPISDGDHPADGLNQPRCDRGERHFRFRLMPGQAGQLMRTVEAHAQAFNQPPFLVSFYPSGQRAKTPKPLVEVRKGCALVTAVKQSIDGRDIIIRLFEPTGRAGKSTLSILGRWQRTIRLGKYELLTLRVDPQTGRTRQVDLMEEPVD
jgi:alpha-mannosidase